MGLSNKLSYEAGSFSHRHNPHRILQPEVLKLYFPHAGILGCAVCLAPQSFLPVYPHASVGPPYPPADTQLPISSPPTSLHECFFFNSLVVTLSYSFDFLAVLVIFCFQICCCPSFGCARRHSVSTYMSILAGSPYFL